MEHLKVRMSSEFFKKIDECLSWKIMKEVNGKIDATEYWISELLKTTIKKSFRAYQKINRNCEGKIFLILKIYPGDLIFIC